jgi:tetratricopeptide (TPR) repeat protein
MTALLYRTQEGDAGFAARLTLLELPNLLAMLQLAEEMSAPEEVVELAGRVERLLSNLGRSQARDEAATVRRDAARRLSAWGHMQFASAFSEVERLLDHGEVRAARDSAERLLERCLEAGERAYPSWAAYDLALAYYMLGKVLRVGGAAAEALPVLEEAQGRFEALVRDGKIPSDTGMSTAALGERGNCLVALGRLDEAAAAYEEGLRRFHEEGDLRGAAICKGHLGLVRLEQRRYDEALSAYEGRSRPSRL